MSREPALIERDAELRAVQGLIDAARAGSGATLVVEAPAGMGKSTLLARGAELAAEQGVWVLTARTDVLERDFPYGVARQLFEPTLRAAAPADLERLLDGAARDAAAVLLGGSTLGRESSTLVAHALYWLAWGLAEEGPLLLVVDDAQWADRASARALLHLARRLEDIPVALLVALRPGEPGAPEEIAERLAGEPRSTAIALGGLSAQAGAQLVRRFHPLATDELCARCHAAAGGNPLLVRELARIVSEAGPDVLAEDGSLRGGAHSPVLDRDVRRRLATLEPAPRAVAEALAVLGDGAAQVHLAALAGVGPAEVSAARDPLVAVGLLGDGEALAFSHAVIRQAVAATLPAGERSRRHRRAAELLRAASASVDAIAAHLLLCDPAGDPDTVATLCAGARQALERGAPETAATYLERALAEPPEAGERTAVLVQLATTEFDCGRPGSADRLREALRDTGDHAARIDVLTRLAALEVLQEGGKADSALFEAERAAVDADPELALAVELAALDVLLMVPGRQGERQQRVAALPAPQSPPSAYDRVALAHRAWLAAERVDAGHDRARELALQALEGGGLLEISKHRVSYQLATRALTVADALDEARAALERQHEDAARRGSLLMRAASAWYLADVHFRAGRIADAENEARLVLALHDEYDQVHSGAIEALVNALVERGALDEAARVLHEQRRDGELGEHYRDVGLRMARARLALARGDAGAALADALDCGRLRDQQGRPNPAWTPWRSTAAIAALRLGERERALALADAELSLAREFGAPRAIGIALRARALAEEDEAVALELHGEAVGVLAASAAALEHAHALHDLGAAIRRAGDLTAAREPLRHALAEADRLGAAALAVRAREELVASGLRPRRAPITGAAALTPRQRRVCELAAAGRTNRAIAQELFVTVKTVETHLLAAYRKLGVASKTELARALRA